MKAVVWTRFGPPDVLQLRDIPKPRPKHNEVLIRVRAATVTAGDCEIRSLKIPLPLRLPLRIYMSIKQAGAPGAGRGALVLGQELAGEVEAVGSDVSRFWPGDQVFAWAGFSFGAYAEYTCLPEDGMLALKPSRMSYEEAATLPVGGLEAIQFLGSDSVRGGERVLINGAGGSIGSYAIQMAKIYGAHVTGVDSAEKLKMLRKTGADAVIDYAREDFTRRGETYDVIFDVAGTSPYARSVDVLTPEGRYLLGNPRPFQDIRAKWTSARGSKKVISRANKTTAQLVEDMEYLVELVEAGRLKAVIDKTYPLEQLAEAHRYVEAGHKKGNVAITV